MGWCNYIIYDSNENLFLKTFITAQNEPKENEIDVEISPDSIERVYVVKIDYLFTEPDETVRTKSRDVTKTALYCIY